jgi:hypothetical protein
VIVENDNKNCDFGGSVTWRIMQFGESGGNHEYCESVTVSHKACSPQVLTMLSFKAKIEVQQWKESHKINSTMTNLID